jgi:hypothetical protein
MRRAFAALAAAFLLRAVPLAAQSTSPEVAPSTAAGRAMGSKEDRILWFYPNYRTVDEENSFPRISPREKMTIGIRDSFDPYAFPIAGAFAGLTYYESSDTSWGHGADRYGKLYLASFADQTMSNMMTESVFPVLLHEDPRYFRLGRGGILHRTGYALSRVFVARDDSRELGFNVSEFGGNAVMAAAGNLYYPREDRTFRDTSVRYGTQIGFDLLANVAQEFWPDVRGWLTGR